MEQRGFAKNTQRCASSRKVGLSQVEARLIGELCFVDCLMLALIFETSCVCWRAQVNWSLVCWCARWAWFLSGMLIETEGVGNPTAEQKHHQHHHTNTTTAASKSDIFKIKVLAQVEERIWSDADLPVTRRDVRPVGRFCFQLDFHTWRRALGWRTLFFGLCCARALFL